MKIKAGIKKRKATDFVEKKRTEVEEGIHKGEHNDEEESDDLMQRIKEDNEDVDTTDDEGIDELHASDDSDELSFESDEDGNFFKINENDEGEDEQDDSDEEENDDDEDDDDEEDNDTEEEDDSDDDEDLTSDEELGSEDEVDSEESLTDLKIDQNKKGFNKEESRNNTKNGKVKTVPHRTGKLNSENSNIPDKTEKHEQTGINAHTKVNKEIQIPRVEGTFKISKKKKKKSALEQFKNTLDNDFGREKEKDEYEHDTSDEEDIRNTVGNIPMHWYDEYKHIGYDWDAKKIMKPPKGDQIDDFLKKIEDPNFWRTVKDPQTGQEVVLSEADIEFIKRINSGRLPDAKFNDYEPWIEWFTSEAEKMPVKNVPDHKRSFLPSQSEKKKVSKMVHALKMGWTKTTEEIEKEFAAKKGPKFYMLWETDTGREDMRRIHDPVSAPKRDLPGHAESYNPPPEYLFDEKEIKEWEKLKDEPYKRKLHFVPQKYKSLREVPAYDRYVRERFLRCLDLYLCPRARRMKLNIDAEYLIPKLPSPRDLQPFPTTESLIYKGHTDLVRSISVEPKGEYLVSGCDDKTVKIWEISTGRCIRTIETDDVIRCVAWCPNPKLSLIAVASGQQLLLINPKVGDKIIVKKTDDLLLEAPPNDELESERIKTAVQWGAASKEERDLGVRVVIKHFKPIRQVTWHGKGDYFATVMPEGANRSALIHQLSKRRTQIPFSKSKGLIQCVLFHPVKPCLFVATQHNIRIYDLVKQELVKKLLSNSKWISGMSIHPKGDNLLVSTYDKKMLWFDLDLSTKPYQTMRLHKTAVRSVAFHLRYPLFASASDDRSVIVSHGMVYNDLLQNPLIVPLKKLQTHEARDEFGVLDVVWHPTQPWVFSSGADATIRLYS